MLASLELLEDVEQQVKQSIGLAENVSISDISEEQLQLVPAELLSALDVSAFCLSSSSINTWAV